MGTMYTKENPAFQGIAARTWEIPVPEEGELFKLQGQDSIGLMSGGKWMEVDPYRYIADKFGIPFVPAGSGRVVGVPLVDKVNALGLSTWGAVQDWTIEQLQADLGLDVSQLHEYSIADIVSAGFPSGQALTTNQIQAALPQVGTFAAPGVASETVTGPGVTTYKELATELQPQIAGQLSPELKARLEKEAPETLKEPKREDFTSDESYQTAKQKFDQYGHWSTPEPTQPVTAATTPKKGTPPNPSNPFQGIPVEKSKDMDLEAAKQYWRGEGYTGYGTAPTAPTAPGASTTPGAPTEPADWSKSDIVLDGRYALVKFSDDPTPDDIDDRGTIWLFDDREKTYRPFVSPQAIQNYLQGVDLADINEVVQTIPTSALQNPAMQGQFIYRDYGIQDDGSIPEGDPVTVPGVTGGAQVALKDTQPGRAYKDPNSNKIYIKEGGILKHIPDEETYRELFPTDPGITQFDVLATTPEGAVTVGTMPSVTGTGVGTPLTGDTDTLKTIYGSEKQPLDAEQTAGQQLGMIMTRIKREGGISQATFDKYVAGTSGDWYAKAVNAFLYGGYTIDDLYRDLKAKELADAGDSAYADVKGFDEAIKAEEWYKTDIGQKSKGDETLTPPIQEWEMDPDLFGLPIFQIPGKAFSTIIEPIDWTSPEFKAEAEKIEASWYDVMMQKSEATTEQQQAVAENNWQMFKDQIERNYGIALSDNANAAWDQLQNMFAGAGAVGLGKSGLVQETMDRYLRDIRKGDQRLRDEKVEKVELEQRNKLLTSGTTEEIAAFVAENPEKAAAWGLTPSAEIKQWYSRENLKSLYPDMSEDEISTIIGMVLDENGNYRSELYQDLYANKYQLGEEKRAYQESKLYEQKLLEEERAYAPYTTSSPFSSYAPEYAKMTEAEKAEMTFTPPTTPVTTPSTITPPDPSNPWAGIPVEKSKDIASTEQAKQYWRNLGYTGYGTGYQYEEGKAYKDPASAKVYIYQGGQLKHIPSEEAYRGLYPGDLSIQQYTTLPTTPTGSIVGSPYEAAQEAAADISETPSTTPTPTPSPYTSEKETTWYNIQTGETRKSKTIPSGGSDAGWVVG